MTRNEPAYEQLRRANPVPDPAALLEELTAADTSEGRGTMTTITTDARRPRPSHGRRHFTAGLSTAVVVLLLGVTTIFVTTAGEASPVEIAEAYLDARNDYDAERALDLVSENFTTTEAPDGYVDRETLELAFRTHQDLGFEFADVTCEQDGETTPEQVVRVECEFLWTTEIHRSGDFDPTPTRYVLSIQDGLIVDINEYARYGPWWNSFRIFIASEAPDDFAAALDRHTQLDPEAVEKLSEELPHYLDLYAEWIDNQDG